MTCSNLECVSGRPVIAQGLCQQCYHRKRRNGSVVRKYVVNKGVCKIEGCEAIALSKNLCTRHYFAQQHPMVNTWKLIRSRAPGQYPKRWEKFNEFLSDVGERPSPKHQLRRIDPERPWSKTNAKWLAPIKVKRDHLSAKERSVYSREWHLQKRFGVNSDRYLEMLVQQGAVCAICGKPESFVNTRSGKLQELSVDHNHKTGVVRGLLCVGCNRGLGYLGEDAQTLRRAADYVDGHNGVMALPVDAVLYGALACN